MAEDFAVVPEALRDMWAGLLEAHDDWDTMRKTLNSYVLDTFSYGVLGELATYSSSYNAMREEIVARLSVGVESLWDTARTLESVAKHYSQKDAEYYEQFGYLEAETD
jgi:hypothetical protein